VVAHPIVSPLNETMNKYFAVSNFLNFTNRRVLCGSAAGLLLTCFSNVSAAELRAPFDTRMPDTKASPKACPALTPPITSFDLQSKYGAAQSGNQGNKRDALNDEAEAAFEASMKPIKAFMGDVVKAANDYHRTGRQSAAACALAHLAHWAKNDALREPGTHTSYYKLATTVAGLSSAMMQIEPALAKNSADRLLVTSWLATRASQISTYFEELKTPRSSRNNHRAWAGLAVASAGIVASNKTLLNWGLASYKLVVCQATTQGALPLELERGSKAREYHLYALAALAPLAEIGSKNGMASYSECNDALHRVAAFTIAAIENPAEVKALAGVKQSGGDKLPSASKLTFLESYGTRFPTKIAGANALFKQRPLGLTDLGGNQTLLYAK
jgi:poly(beta-D-mannuronate) lyase